MFLLQKFIDSRHNDMRKTWINLIEALDYYLWISHQDNEVPEPEEAWLDDLQREYANIERTLIAYKSKNTCEPTRKYESEVFSNLEGFCLCRL